MTDAAPAPRTCEICGRPPAMAIYASMYSGRVLFGDELFWKGDACRQCAICQYRAGLTHCLWAGWWAPVALVVNPRMIWRNASGLRAAHAMPPPEGAPLAEPLDEGRPVLARPAAIAGLVAPIVLIGLVVAVVLAVTGTSRLDDLAAGQCIDLPSTRQIDHTDEVACSGRHDAEVTGVITSAKVPSDDELCADETTSYLGRRGRVEGLVPAAIRISGDRRVVCLITSDDGSPLTGSHRNAGR